MTLTTQNETFTDWKRRRCRLGIHFKEVTFTKHTKTRVIKCSRCNKKLN